MKPRQVVGCLDGALFGPSAHTTARGWIRRRTFSARRFRSGGNDTVGQTSKSGFAGSLRIAVEGLIKRVPEIASECLPTVPVCPGKTLRLQRPPRVRSNRWTTYGLPRSDVGNRQDATRDVMQTILSLTGGRV